MKLLIPPGNLLHFFSFYNYVDMDVLPIELLAAVNMTVIASGQLSVAPLAALPLVSAPPLHGLAKKVLQMLFKFLFP